MTVNDPNWANTLGAGRAFRMYPASPPNDNDVLWSLLERAARALQAEDLELRNALSQNPHKRDVGQGLSYWVFEHNLVYPIFRDWCRDQPVLWDESPNASYRGRRRKMKAKPESKKCIDLQLGIVKHERLRFEAKWWTRGRNPRATFKDDLVKLRLSRSGQRNFCMAFWYGIPAEHEKDFTFNEQAPFDSAPVFAACFPSRVFTSWHKKSKAGPPKLTDGYFAMVVWEVTGKQGQTSRSAIDASQPPTTLT